MGLMVKSQVKFGYNRFGWLAELLLDGGWRYKTNDFVVAGSAGG